MFGDKMKILITGSNGMLGHDLIDVLKDSKKELKELK